MVSLVTGSFESSKEIHHGTSCTHFRDIEGVLVRARCHYLGIHMASHGRRSLLSLPTDIQAALIAGAARPRTGARPDAWLL